jgi:uncharacterized protein YeaC (DUF1315 family)
MQYKSKATRNIEISYVTKAEGSYPDKCIAFIGGKRPDGKPWKLSEEQAILSLQKGISFFIRKNKSEIPVIAITRNKQQFLTTALDRERPDHLLCLPDCPEDKDSGLSALQSSK